MPRNMSFTLTKEQVLNQTKTVTHRLGWAFLNPGDIFQPVERIMSLKKGEKVKKLGPLAQCTSNTAEPIAEVVRRHGIVELAREGFDRMTEDQFITFFCFHMNCKPEQIVNRIEFRYLRPGKGG